MDRDGTVKPTWPIMAGRELYRRTSAIMYKHRGERGLYQVHHATTLIMPVLSFVNSIYDGEFTGWGDIQQEAKKKGIPAGHTEDRRRCILSMSAFGHVPHIDSRNLVRWIEWDIDARFGKSRPYGYVKSARDNIGRYLLTDVHDLWHPIQLRWLRHVLDWWGIADPNVEFLPYWAKKPAATINSGGLIGGYINRKTGRVLLIILGGRSGSPKDFLRRSQYGRNVEVKLDLEQLGLEPGKFRATNAETFGKREYPSTANQISLIRGHGNVLMLVCIDPLPSEKGGQK